jgi:hypothetical protein
MTFQTIASSYVSHRKTVNKLQMLGARAHKQLKQASKKARDGEMSISAQAYHGILHDGDINFDLTVFSEVLPEAKKLFKIMLTKSNSICYRSKRGENNFLTGNCNIFKSFDQKVRDSHCQTKITQNL